MSKYNWKKKRNNGDFNSKMRRSEYTYIQKALSASLRGFLGRSINNEMIVSMTGSIEQSLQRLRDQGAIRSYTLDVDNGDVNITLVTSFDIERITVKMEI